MKEHKTLLQYKREIEEDIKAEMSITKLRFDKNLEYLEKQLQMIDDIIEQVDTQLELSQDFECCQEVLNEIKGE